MIPLSTKGGKKNRNETGIKWRKHCLGRERAPSSPGEVANIVFMQMNKGSEAGGGRLGEQYRSVRGGEVQREADHLGCMGQVSQIGSVGLYPSSNGKHLRILIKGVCDQVKFVGRSLWRGQKRCGPQCSPEERSAWHSCGGGGVARFYSQHVHQRIDMGCKREAGSRKMACFLPSAVGDGLGWTQRMGTRSGR